MNNHPDISRVNVPQISDCNFFLYDFQVNVSMQNSSYDHMWWSEAYLLQSHSINEK